MSERLSLKWGSLKGWEVESDASKAALEKYFNDPVSMSAMSQRDTPAQKAAVLELIEVIDGPIWNDWDGVQMTKAEAKEYVSNYRTPKP